jgi:peptidyl-dipeptidase A
MNFLAMNAYAQNTAPTAADAQFMNQAEARLSDLSVKVQRASWVQENFITEDTQAIAADAIDEIAAVTTQLVEQAKRFEGLALSPELSRRFMLLKLGLTAPAPKDPALPTRGRRRAGKPASSVTNHVGLEAFGGARKARADECVRRYASKC